MSTRKKYPQWTRSTFGIGALSVPCWVKSFGDGLVSVGIDPDVFIVYDYGDDHGDSWCDSRERSEGVTWTVAEAMKAIDEQGGKCPKERCE